MLHGTDPHMDVDGSPYISVHPGLPEKGADKLDYYINILHSEEDGGYIADIPDLEACSAFGATPQEALEQVEKAKRLWLEEARAENKPIPSPR